MYDRASIISLRFDAHSNYFAFVLVMQTEVANLQRSHSKHLSAAASFAAAVAAAAAQLLKSEKCFADGQRISAHGRMMARVWKRNLKRCMSYLHDVRIPK